MEEERDRLSQDLKVSPELENFYPQEEKYRFKEKSEKISDELKSSINSSSEYESRLIAVQKSHDVQAESWKSQISYYLQEIQELKSANEKDRKSLVEAQETLIKCQGQSKEDSIAWEHALNENEMKWASERQYLQERVQHVEVYVT